MSLTVDYLRVAKRDSEIMEDHTHPQYSFSQPNALKRLGAIRIASHNPDENLIVGTTTYILKAALGAPGVGEVHVKIQGTILDTVKMLVKALQGLTDAVNIAYNVQAANAEAQALWTAQVFSLGITTLAAAGGTGAGTIYLRELLADQTAAFTLTSTTTNTSIALDQFFDFRYTTVANNISGGYLCLFPTGHFPFVYDMNILNLNAVTNGLIGEVIEFDLYYSSDEITFTRLEEAEKSILTSNKDSKIIPIHQRRIPIGYGLYAKARTSGIAGEFADFSITGHRYPVNV